MTDHLEAEEFETQELIIADPGKRFLAYLIDSLILAIPIVVIFSLMAGSLVAAGTFNNGEVSDTAIAGMMAGYFGFIFIAIILVAIYFAYFESSPKQATLGKQAMGIYVTNLQGERISFLNALGRYLAKILSGMILYVGYIMIIFTKNHQGLHDMLASTLVLKRNK